MTAFNNIRGTLPSTTTNAIAKPAAPVQSPAAPTAQPKAEPADPMAAMMAELARLKAENEALKTKGGGGARGAHLSFKVSEKGCLSIYGLGRFPTVLYKSQWQRIVDAVKDGSLEKALTLPGLKEALVKE